MMMVDLSSYPIYVSCISVLCVCIQILADTLVELGMIIN